MKLVERVITSTREHSVRRWSLQFTHTFAINVYVSHIVLQ